MVGKEFRCLCMYKNVYISFKVFSILKRVVCLVYVCMQYLCILKIKVHVTKNCSSLVRPATCLHARVNMCCPATCSSYLQGVQDLCFLFQRSNTALKLLCRVSRLLVVPIGISMKSSHVQKVQISPMLLLQRYCRG